MPVFESRLATRRVGAAGILCWTIASCGGSGQTYPTDGGAGGVISTPDAAPGNGGSGGQGAAGGSGGNITSPDTGSGSGAAPGSDVAPDRPADVAASDVPEDAASADRSPAVDSAFRLATMTLEALQVAGTHNSYHQAPLIPFDASHKYTHKPLDQQLDGGIRALELDLHLGNSGAFEIYHILGIDPNSSCKVLDDCLRTVATWSTAHPRHVPIFIWFELKDDTGGKPINDLMPVEETILRVFPRERVLTPAWLRGNYASPRERLSKDGWPTIDEARGKIMFTIINRDARTKAYAHDGTSLDDRLMWVNAAPEEYGLPWAAITKDVGDAESIAKAHAAHILLGINVCAVNNSDDACAARLGEFMGAGLQLLMDDLPFQISGRAYWLHLPDGSPGCNVVTAPAGCRASGLE